MSFEKLSYAIHFISLSFFAGLNFRKSPYCNSFPRIEIQNYTWVILQEAYKVSCHRIFIEKIIAVPKIL